MRKPSKSAEKQIFWCICFLLVLALISGYYLLDIVALPLGAPPQSQVDLSHVQVLSWNPRIEVYKGFLSETDADYLIDLASPHVSRSEVVSATGRSETNTARTSSGYFLTYYTQRPMIKSLAHKIAVWTQIPEENGEVFYVIRYDKGQEYKPHHDYFSEDERGQPFIGDRGNRIATVLLYLHPATSGGETVFPDANVTVSASKGDAILFWSANPHAKEKGGGMSLNPDSLHGGKPVKEGQKWVMTKWIRERASPVDGYESTLITIVAAILVVLILLLAYLFVHLLKRVYL